MKKRLATGAIANALQGASLFFQRRGEPHGICRPRRRPRPGWSRRPPSNATRSVRPNARTRARRSVKRYSFKLSDDQLRGGTLNMSVIVRRAIDRYLAEVEPRGE